MGSSNQDKLAGVDLQQDQDLVAHHEDRSGEGHLHPGVALLADQVSFCSRVVRVFVHELEPHDDRDECERAEEDVGQKEHSHLLHEELLVVPEFVEVERWQVVPVNQIVEIVEHKVKDLLCKNENAYG